ncbi:hypothetical protein HYY73_01300 [Candidatus Woesearchaeota archaeon]|nr:hypothetical protein [Candidatus Woesearchaeota archaeon]
MKSSVFIRIDRYKELSEVIRQIMSKLEDAKQALKKAKDLKSQEDAELENWQTELKSTEQKLEELSRAITEK